MPSTSRRSKTIGTRWPCKVPTRAGSITPRPAAVGNSNCPDRVSQPAGALLPLPWLLGMPSLRSTTSTLNCSRVPASSWSKLSRAMRNTPWLLDNQK